MIPAGKVALSVITNCGMANELATDPFNATMSEQAPEFLYFVQNANGQNPVAAIQAQTGAYVGPPNLMPGATFTPAKPNDVLTVFGVGWGATEPACHVGWMAPAAATLSGQYSLTIGGIDTPILYAGLTPTYAGLYQVNFYVPTSLAPGNHSIVLTVNGMRSPSGAFLTIGP
jgi:uncharacterized protein (TIGR03437 family)